MSDFILASLSVELLFAAAVVGGSFVLAKAAYWFLKEYAQKITAKTKTTFDDKMLVAFEAPLVLSILIAGIYFGFLQIMLLKPFEAVLTRLFSVSWVLVVALFLLRTGSALSSWYAEEATLKRRQGMADLLPTLNRVWKAFVISIAAIMVLDNFGVEITPLIASLGIAGLAVALAFQDTLANFFAGLYITADRPVKVGEYIKLDTGDEGYVVNIGWRSTQIRTLPNNIVVIPNSKLAASVITNYYAPDKQMAALVNLSVGYDSNLEKVERVTVEVARQLQKRIPGAVNDFEPFVRFNTFADSGVGFTVILRVNEFTDQFLLKHEFVKALHARFRKEGIEIPYPKRDVYLKRGKIR